MVVEVDEAGRDDTVDPYTRRTFVSGRRARRLVGDTLDATVGDVHRAAPVRAAVFVDGEHVTEHDQLVQRNTLRDRASARPSSCGLWSYPPSASNVRTRGTHAL